MAVDPFETKTRAKDPADRLDYQINWAAFLTDGDVIGTSSWATYTDKWTDTDEIAVEQDSSTDTTATVWVTGGVAGANYFVTNHIITAAGREKDLSIKFICREQ